MSEVKRYHVTEAGLVEGQALGRINVVLGADHDRIAADADRLRAELECSRGDFAQLERIRDALQQRLTAADDWADLIRALLRRLVRNIDQECYCAEDLEQQDDQFNSIIKSIRADLKAADDSKPSTCTWSEGGFSWHTGCGKEWQFTDGGLPAENGMRFCHSCGKALIVEDSCDDD